MLLTLKPPSSHTPGFSSPHAYTASRAELKAYSPSESKLVPLINTGNSSPQTMSAPHRGLPPPIGMTLPNPNPDGRHGPPPQPPPPPPPQHQALSQNQPMGQLPAPPSSQWAGSGGDAMRDWLAAKAEEDRRKQEEERTRQETLRLEQRKIEQSMLRESLQGGIPPHMVPIVFAGMGGGQLANAGVEWAQHYISQMTVQPQPAQQQLPPPHGSPDIRRDRAYPGPQPNPYAAHQPPQARNYPYDNARPGQAQIQAGPTSAPRPSASSLSRLNTGEMSIHQPPPPGAPLPTQPPNPHSQAEQTAQSTPTSSQQGIYFHHWVPPNNSKDAGSPSDFPNSPKKRKTNAQGKTPDISPSFSHPSSASRRHRALSLQKSETSTDSSRESGRMGPITGSTGHVLSRPQSRQRQHSLSSVAESGLRHESLQPDQSPTTSPIIESRIQGRKRSRSNTPNHEGPTP